MSHAAFATFLLSVGASSFTNVENLQPKQENKRRIKRERGNSNIPATSPRPTKMTRSDTSTSRTLNDSEIEVIDLLDD